MDHQLLPLGKSKGNGTDDSGNSVFSIQLKKLLYRALSNLETKIKQEESFVGSSTKDANAGINDFGGKEKSLIIKGPRQGQRNNGAICIC